MTYLISPAEPLEIRALGQSSPVPEMLGCDIVWSGRKGLCGVQRKTIPDLISSVRDNRLGREFEQMERLVLRGLVVEGSPHWTRDGELLGQYGTWSLKQHRGVLMSAQVKGVIVVTTANHLESLDAIVQMQEWSLRDETVSSLLYRGNRRNEWGNLDDRTTACHFLSGIPSIGLEIAGRIFDHFGRVPISWDVTAEELSQVKGIGKKRAEQLTKVLGTKTRYLVTGADGVTDANL